MSLEAIGAPAPESTIVMDVAPPVGTSKPVGLHSPPDSNNAMNLDGSDSELSDIDDEDVDKLDDSLKDDLKRAAPQPKAEPVPDPEPSSPKLNPEVVVEDDIGEVLPDHWSGTVPVFRPTMKQFQDFKLFVRQSPLLCPCPPLFCADSPSRWKKSTSMA